MTPADLLAHLRDEGIEVSLAGTQLTCRPRGRLSPGDRALVVAHKPALVEYLARQRLAWETFLLAETFGFPWVRLRPGLAIAGDRAGWATFLCGPPDPEDLLRAYVAVLDEEGLAR
jgi:TubC N-terminal docking domain